MKKHLKKIITKDPTMTKMDKLTKDPKPGKVKSHDLGKMSKTSSKLVNKEENKAEDQSKHPKKRKLPIPN